MATVHLALFVLAAVGAAALLAVALVGAATRRYSVLWADRLILADLAAVLLAAIVGPLLLVTGHKPQDLLHVVYAVVAAAALPLGRYAARSGSPRRRATAMAVASLVLLGVLLRLYMTG